MTTNAPDPTPEELAAFRRERLAREIGVKTELLATVKGGTDDEVKRNAAALLAKFPHMRADHAPKFQAPGEGSGESPAALAKSIRGESGGSDDWTQDDTRNLAAEIRKRMPY